MIFKLMGIALFLVIIATGVYWLINNVRIGKNEGDKH